MSRLPNKLQTVEVKLSTTPPVAAYLDGLVETGLYGKNRSEAAERLVTRGIESLIKDGTLATKLRFE
jgi:hypothetical protein